MTAQLTLQPVSSHEREQERGRRQVLVRAAGDDQAGAGQRLGASVLVNRPPGLVWATLSLPHIRHSHGAHRNSRGTSPVKAVTCSQAL